MPFNELQRRDSWPPTILRIHGTASDTSAENDENEFDENPISWYLTTPEELDAFYGDDDEELSAGIETESSKSPVIREVSPSSVQRLARQVEEDEEDDQEDLDDDDEEAEMGIAMPLSLKAFTARTNNSGRTSRARQRPEDALAGLGIKLPDNDFDFSKTGRGRAKVRLTPTRGNTRGRGQTRSLSARRKPHSWRVPSPDIWEIKEESEEGSPKEEKTEKETLVSASAPTTSHISQGEMGILLKGSSPKPKKKVHWAI